MFPKPELLLLDDIFSSLDTITANRILQRLLGPEGIIRQLGAGVIIVTVAGNFANEYMLLFVSDC